LQPSKEANGVSLGTVLFNEGENGDADPCDLLGRPQGKGGENSQSKILAGKAGKKMRIIRTPVQNRGRHLIVESKEADACTSPGKEELVFFLRRNSEDGREKGGEVVWGKSGLDS